MRPDLRSLSHPLMPYGWLALTYSAVLVALDCQLLISPRARERVCVSSEEREYSTQTHTHTFLASKIDAVHPSSGVDLFPRPPFYIPQCTVIWRVRQHLARLLHRFIPSKEFFLLGFPTIYVRSGSLNEVFKN